MSKLTACTSLFLLAGS